MSRPTVLIADDNTEWRELIARILESEYESIGFAAYGDDVVPTAVALRPDVITLDVSMPGVGGLQLLPRLRSAAPNAVIVIVSTTFDRLYVDAAYKRGADGYVPKQKVLSDLIPAIKKNAMGRQA